MPIKINFAGDNNVINHIVGSPDPKQLIKQKSTPIKIVTPPSEENSDKENNDESACLSKLSDLSLMSEDLNDSGKGKGLFQFQSPKSSKSMLLKAFDSAQSIHTKTTPKSAKKSGTPKSKAGSSRKGTPVGRGKKKNASRDTPQRLRSRYNTQVSSDESSDEVDEEEVEAPIEEDVKVSKGGKDTTALKYSQNLKDAVEDYFLLHSGDSASDGVAVKTSDRTLAKLGAQRPDPVTVRALLAKMARPYAANMDRLRRECVAGFPRMLIELKENFNLLLYGVGSKKHIIEAFRKFYLSEEDCLVVPGYQPNIIMRQVINLLCTKFLPNNKDTAKNMPDQVKQLRYHFDREDCPDLYLLVHNIDGPQFRHERHQSAFSTLACAKHIHLVASVDHINASILWSPEQSSQFNWVWHDCTTLADYAEETSHENSLLVQNSGSLALTSLRHVMVSLTKNARDIFLLIAEHQLENTGDPSYQGLPLDDLYWRCRDAFLVNSEVTLRAQLTEFKDHQLLKFKKGFDGVELLSIPLENCNLQEFVQNFEDYQ